MAGEPARPVIRPDLHLLIRRGPQRFRKPSAGVPQGHRRTVQLEAGNGLAEWKEWAMSTHAIGTKGRFRPAAVGIVLASAIALGADSWASRSSRDARRSRPTPVSGPYASKGGWIDSYSHTAFIIVARARGEKSGRGSGPYRESERDVSVETASLVLVITVAVLTMAP